MIRVFKKIKVIIPSEPCTLKNMPNDWECVGNCCYFGNAGALVGLAANQGVISPDRGKTSVTQHWPTFYMEDKPSFGAFNAERAQKAVCAFSAGPMLARNGAVLDIIQEMQESHFSFYNPHEKKAQRAIGITAEGYIADGIWTNASLYEVAREMLMAGCVSAMKMDSGGSSGRIYKGVLEGHSVRLLPAAVAYREEIGGAKMKVYIDPGHGGKDPGGSGHGILEKDVVLDVALRLQKELRRYNCEIRLSRTTDIYKSLDDRVAEANNWKADLFLSIHSNAHANPNVNGYEDYTYPTVGARTSEIRKVIHSNLAPIWIAEGRQNLGMKTANFQVLRDTVMPAVLVENGYLTNEADARLISDPEMRQRLAIALSKGVAQALGLVMVEPTELEARVARLEELVDKMKVFWREV